MIGSEEATALMTGMPIERVEFVEDDDEGDYVVITAGKVRLYASEPQAYTDLKGGG
jgi:hypothetical protein